MHVVTEVAAVLRAHLLDICMFRVSHPVLCACDCHLSLLSFPLSGWQEGNVAFISSGGYSLNENAIKQVRCLPQCNCAPLVAPNNAGL